MCISPLCSRAQAVYSGSPQLEEKDWKCHNDFVFDDLIEACFNRMSTLSSRFLFGDFALLWCGWWGGAWQFQFRKTKCPRSGASRHPKLEIWWMVPGGASEQQTKQYDLCKCMPQIGSETIYQACTCANHILYLMCHPRKARVDGEKESDSSSNYLATCRLGCFLGEVQLEEKGSAMPQGHCPELIHKGLFIKFGIRTFRLSINK